MSNHFQGVDSPTNSPRKRPQSARVAGKNATVTIPLAAEVAGGSPRGGLVVNNSSSNYNHQHNSSNPQSFTPRRPSDAIPIPIPTGGRDSSLHQPKYQTATTNQNYRSGSGGVFTSNNNNNNGTSRPVTSTSILKNGTTGETPVAVDGQQQQQQIGGNRVPSRPTSAKTRWGEKRHTVKTSQEVMSEVAASIKDSEAKAMLAVGTNVKVCDQPGSGKFNTVFHLKGNHELQTEAHRTLMNTRFSAGDQDRIVHEEPPSHEALFRAAASSSRPMSAKSRVSLAGEGVTATSGGGAATAKVRPQSAKSARSSSYSRPVTSVGGMTVTNSAVGSSGAIGGSSSTATTPLEGMMVQGSKVQDFQTFWHVQTNEQLRTDAMLNYSLGIHKEPFVPPADRVKFRNSKEEAKHPFEDAELRAETANASRPATPRSVLNFFGVDDESSYHDVDRVHDEEWKHRVMRKIAEVDKKSKKPGEGKYFSLYRSQYYKHLKEENHNGSLRSQSPRTEDGRQPLFVVRGKGTMSKTPSSAPKTDSRLSNRQPLRGGNHRMTAAASTPDAPMSRTASRAAAKKAHGTKATAATTGAPQASKNIAHPKDVYAWNEQVVIPIPPQAAVTFRSQSAAH